MDDEVLLDLKEMRSRRERELGDCGRAKDGMWWMLNTLIYYRIVARDKANGS